MQTNFLPIFPENETPEFFFKKSVGGSETATELHARLLDKWKVERGQLWRIGSRSVAGGHHAVACGDCRDWSDVSRLIGARAVDGVFTSPPYANQRGSTYGGIDPLEYLPWFDTVQACVDACLATGGSFFLNVDTFARAGRLDLYLYRLVLQMCEVWGWSLVDEFCWQRLGPPGYWPDRFKSGWEPVYHFARPKERIKFRPDNVKHASNKCFAKDGPRREMGTGSGFGCKADNQTGLALPSNVIATHNSLVSGHSAAFPPELPAFFLRAFSDPGDVWLDPFVGSGSTLLACEASGRQCRGMEILPAHVAVLLERCEANGLTPESNSGV